MESKNEQNRDQVTRTVPFEDLARDIVLRVGKLTRLPETLYCKPTTDIFDIHIDTHT